MQSNKALLKLLEKHAPTWHVNSIQPRLTILDALRDGPINLSKLGRDMGLQSHQAVGSHLTAMERDGVISDRKVVTDSGMELLNAFQ